MAAGNGEVTADLNRIPQRCGANTPMAAGFKALP
jgi:hypothetical protein